MNLNKKHLYLSILLSASLSIFTWAQDVPKDFIDPPREFSVMPFWFWNDTLTNDEIIRQIADFDAHGVGGFMLSLPVDHPEADERPHP